MEQSTTGMPADQCRHPTTCQPSPLLSHQPSQTTALTLHHVGYDGALGNRGPAGNAEVACNRGSAANRCATRHSDARSCDASRHIKCPKDLSRPTDLREAGNVEAMQHTEAGAPCRRVRRGQRAHRSSRRRFPQSCCAARHCSELALPLQIAPPAHPVTPSSSHPPHRCTRRLPSGCQRHQQRSGGQQT